MGGGACSKESAAGQEGSLLEQVGQVQAEDMLGRQPPRIHSPATSYMPLSLPFYIELPSWLTVLA